MKKSLMFVFIFSTVLFLLFFNLKNNSVEKIEVSYIEDTMPNDVLNLTASVPQEILEYKEENNILKPFSGVKTHTYQDITFNYLNSWIEVDVQEISDPTFLINGRNAVFNIIKETAPENFTLDDYISSTKEVLKKENNITIIYDGKVTINNIDGFNLVYTITEDNVTNYLNQFCVIKNNTIYVFSYYSDEENYNTYLKDFQDLLLTLSIG